MSASVSMGGVRGPLIYVPEATESSTKPSDTVTLPITFTNGTDFLEGEFEANNEVYEVSVRKKVKGRAE